MGKDQLGHANLVGGDQTDLHTHGISFLDHVDTPLNYTGSAGKFVKVNTIPDGLIFAGLSAGDLPAHSHARVNISNFWSAPFWGSIPDKPSTFTPSAHASIHHSGGSDQVNHDSLLGFAAAEHKSLPNTIAQVLSNHTKAVHDALAIDHGSLGGRGDDDHSIYYNVTRHTTAVHDALSINAHRLDGYHGAGTATANTYALRDASGDIKARLFRSEYDTTNPTCNLIMTQIDSASNNYLRPSTKAQVIASLNLMTKAGGTFTGYVYARDHGTAATDMIVNVCYGTGSPPAASGTTIGTLFVKYTA